LCCLNIKDFWVWPNHGLEIISHTKINNVIVSWISSIFKRYLESVVKLCLMNLSVEYCLMRKRPLSHRLNSITEFILLIYWLNCCHFKRVKWPNFPRSNWDHSLFKMINLMEPFLGIDRDQLE
jgi:hypothetical protein